MIVADFETEEIYEGLLDAGNILFISRQLEGDTWEK